MRLDRMVGALLDLSRIQAGALHARREALDVEDAAGAVIDRLRPLLGGRTVETAFGEDLPPVEADPTFLDQCLANLVENAHAPHAADVDGDRAGRERRRPGRDRGRGRRAGRAGRGRWAPVRPLLPRSPAGADAGRRHGRRPDDRPRPRPRRWAARSTPRAAPPAGCSCA